MDSWILKREILSWVPLPPSLQGAVAGTSGRVGTLDLTFQFDNPLTGQARGQNSLVGYRHPQNISSPRPVGWRPQGNKNRPIFPCSFASWSDRVEDLKDESTIELLVHNASPRMINALCIRRLILTCPPIIMPRFISATHHI